MQVNQKTQRPDIESVIALAVDQILNARDCCGDEREAATDVFVENGYSPKTEHLAKAFGEANRQWRQSQADAGVTPKKRIHDAERRQIERALND